MHGLTTIQRQYRTIVVDGGLPRVVLPGMFERKRAAGHWEKGGSVFAADREGKRERDDEENRRGEEAIQKSLCKRSAA